MTYDPFEPLPIGSTGVRVTRLGFGSAPIGGLYEAVSDEAAVATVRHAWDLGIRYFDVAPLYGYGSAERCIGLGLAGQPRGSFALSTKVGRLLRAPEAIAAGMDRDRQIIGGEEDSYFRGTPDERPVFDYSFEGVLRSVEESLDRLRLERIDILFIHDPDDHWQAAISGAYPALERLRAEGRVGAIGAGMNQSAMLARFVRETDMDVLLVAGRYTLLDQEALGELMPLCVQKGVAVVIGGVMNSGILADPRPGSHFDYKEADAAWVARAERLRTVCARHDVPLKTAAVQFVLAHPAVVSIVAGVRTAAHLDTYPDLMRAQVPDALWDELRAEGLLLADAPTPVANAAASPKVPPRPADPAGNGSPG